MIVNLQALNFIDIRWGDHSSKGGSRTISRALAPWPRLHNDQDPGILPGIKQRTEARSSGKEIYTHCLHKDFFGNPSINQRQNSIIRPLFSFESALDRFFQRFTVENASAPIGTDHYGQGSLRVSNLVWLAAALLLASFFSPFALIFRSIGFVRNIQTNGKQRCR